MKKNMFNKWPMIIIIVSMCCIVNAYQPLEVLPDIMGVKLGRDSLKYVNSLLGDTNVVDEGDAALSRSYICYLYRQNNINQIAVFSSDRELAGPPEYVVTKIELYIASHAPYELGECHQIDSEDLPTTTLIGNNKQEFAEYFGFSSDTVISDDFSKSFTFSVPFSSEDPRYQYWKNRKAQHNRE